MFYVGIDIAKEFHVASIINEFGQFLAKPFKFNNNLQGFSILLSKLDGLDTASILIGMESTAHYGETLCCFLVSKGFKVGIINPLKTHNLRNTKLTKTKNDKIDSVIICQALQLNYHTLVTPKDVLIMELKQFCISRNNLMTMRSKSKIQLVTYLDQVFPEFASFFKGNPHLNVCYQLLKEFPSALAIKKVRIDKLTNLLISASHGRYKEDKAKKLKSLALVSVGIDNNALSLSIQHAISLIELLDSQILQIEDQIHSIMNAINSPILTIPGMGVIMAAYILSSIKDINNFSHPCKLLSYAGIYPTIYQSGNFTNSHGRMAKRGNSMLRYALIFSALNTVKNNATFAQYYELKISQGKSHYNALGHVAFKLVRIIYKILKYNIEFSLA